MSPSDPDTAMETVPPSGPARFNDADLRYLRGALLALRETHGASDVAAASGSDPRVRALARQAGATQADDISAITSMLRGWDRTEVGPTRTALPSDLRSLSGPEVDRRFIEILTAHANASLVRARTEMIEGVGDCSRLHAEDTSRASWRALAALTDVSRPPPPVV
jgi:uncharacterized protein (DUF305 family)